MYVSRGGKLRIIEVDDDEDDGGGSRGMEERYAVYYIDAAHCVIGPRSLYTSLPVCSLSEQNSKQFPRARGIPSGT